MLCSPNLLQRFRTTVVGPTWCKNHYATTLWTTIIWQNCLEKRGMAHCQVCGKLVSQPRILKSSFMSKIFTSFVSEVKPLQRQKEHLPKLLGPQRWPWSIARIDSSVTAHLRLGSKFRVFAVFPRGTKISCQIMHTCMSAQCQGVPKWLLTIPNKTYQRHRHHRILIFLFDHRRCKNFENAQIGTFSPCRLGGENNVLWPFHRENKTLCTGSTFPLPKGAK